MLSHRRSEHDFWPRFLISQTHSAQPKPFAPALPFRPPARHLSVRVCASPLPPAERGPQGLLALEQWACLLAPGRCADLEPFAWASITATHAPEFLARQAPGRVASWVKLVAAANTRKGVEAIVTQTTGLPAHRGGVAAEAGAGAGAGAGVAMGGENLALAGACLAAGVEGRLVVGALDRLADPATATALAAAGGFSLLEVPGVAHAVPLEAPGVWRRDLLAFLDAP